MDLINLVTWLSNTAFFFPWVISILIVYELIID